MTKVQGVQRFIGQDSSVAALQRVRMFLSDQTQLVIRDHSPQSVRPEGLWSPENNRSYGRLAHGFIFLQDWLGVYNQISDAERDELGTLAVTLHSHWQRARTAESSMAYHDETTAQRAIYLSAFLTKYSNYLHNNTRWLFKTQISNDVELLRSDDFYAGNNNHGMFQDIALLVAADLVLDAAEANVTREIAFSRLGVYFHSCFTIDGIHIENSPSYHLMVSKYLSDIIDYSQEIGQDNFRIEFEATLKKADLYAAYAVAPNGSFAPVSDTASIVITPARAHQVFPSGFLETVAKRSKDHPQSKSRAYLATNSGYAIHRTDFGSDKSSYVFFSAAYNADYHKHSDDLSIYIAHDGREILREAGPYGYDRRDPFTGHGFHSRAHNTLLVDEVGLPRTDSHADKLTLEDLGSTTDHLDVVGRCKRFAGVDWRRRVYVTKAGASEPIRISDTVESAQEHAYTFVWHFGPGLFLDLRGNTIEVFSENDEKIAELSWAGSPSESIRLISAQTEPYVQGWVFPSMETKRPASVVEVDFRGRSAQVDWQLRTTDFNRSDLTTADSHTHWQTYHGEKPVRYLLQLPQKKDIERLTVSFTSEIEENPNTPTDLISPFNGAPFARLLIAESSSDESACHLSSNRNLAEFRSVQGLIATVLSQLGLSRAKAVTTGSSVGATVAILHGTMAGLGLIIVADPMLSLGTFLKGSAPESLKYISGGTSDADKNWADSIVGRILASAPKLSRIVMLTGEADSHYAAHVAPLARFMANQGHDTTTMALPGKGDAHIKTALYRLQASLSKSAGGEYPVAHTVSIDESKGIFGAAVLAPWGTKIQAVLFKDGKPITRAQPMGTGVIRWPITGAGMYRARIYLDMPNITDRMAFGTQTIRYGS